MNLLEPAPTPYDLRWRMFGVAVRVHPMFWLATAIFGWNLTQGSNGLVVLLMWILACFASILLHELGHVWMGQAFGAYGHIVLYGFGGLAIGAGDLYRRWQRILVSLAGPGIQLALWAALWALLPRPRFSHFAAPSPMDHFLGFLLEVNLFWPLLNLLPIWPLDGGKISRELCEGGLGPSRGLLTSLRISLLVAAGLACYGLLIAVKVVPPPPPLILGSIVLSLGVISDPYLIIFFALFAFTSYQALQLAQPRRRYEDDDLPWER